MIGWELERERKTFMEREILRKTELQESLNFLIFSFYSSALQSTELSELWAGWGGVTSEWGRLFHSLFSHSSRLSQTWNACPMCWIITCFQVWPKFMLKTHLNFKWELKLNIFYILILKFIRMLFLPEVLCKWKISLYSLNYSESYEEKLKSLMWKESYGEKFIIECRLVTYTDLGGLYIWVDPFVPCNSLMRQYYQIIPIL